MVGYQRGLLLGLTLRVTDYCKSRPPMPTRIEHDSTYRSTKQPISR